MTNLKKLFEEKAAQEDEEIIYVGFDKLTTDTLRTLLFYNETVSVTFIKQDGSERVMNCTLHPAFLPEADHSKSEKKRLDAMDVLKVYDLEKKDWRSFKVDSVLKLKYTAPTGEIIELTKGVTSGRTDPGSGTGSEKEPGGGGIGGTKSGDGGAVL